MQVELTHKETLTIRRLGNAINAGMLPVKELQAFFNGFSRKIESSGSPERNSRKPGRKDRYKTKLKAA